MSQVLILILHICIYDWLRTLLLMALKSHSVLCPLRIDSFQTECWIFEKVVSSHSLLGCLKVELGEIAKLSSDTAKAVVVCHK